MSVGIPLVYQGLMIVSLLVRAGVAMVHSIGTMVDPLPPDQGGQVELRQRGAAAAEPYVSQIPHGDLHEVTVRISVGGRDRGSGVCIDPRGYVLTVRHVIARGRCQVTFPGKDPVHGVVVSSVPEGTDAATLIKCEGFNFPHVAVALTAPVRGSPVELSGFHHKNFVMLRGASEGPSRSLLAIGSSGFPLEQFSVSALRGMSGGPIVDECQRLVSLIVSRSGSKMNGLSLAAIRQATQRVPAAPEIRSAEPLGDGSDLPLLEYWWSRDCAPCRQFAKDFGPGSPHKDRLQRSYNVRAFNAARNRALARERGITKTPAFYLPAEGRLIEGYSDPDSLFEALASATPRQQPDATGSSTRDAESEAVVPPFPTGPLAPLNRETTAAADQQPAGDAEATQPDETVQADNETTGLINRFKQAILETIRLLLAGGIGWFMSWRAQQGFLKRRIIDRVVRRELKKLRRRAEQSPGGRAALHAADQQFRSQQ